MGASTDLLLEALESAWVRSPARQFWGAHVVVHYIGLLCNWMPERVDISCAGERNGLEVQITQVDHQSDVAASCYVLLLVRQCLRMCALGGRA